MLGDDDWAETRRIKSLQGILPGQPTREGQKGRASSGFLGPEQMESILAGLHRNVQGFDERFKKPSSVVENELPDSPSRRERE